ncbi:MAG: hemerythrin family protein [Deltaproteobacteria bacterium]|nr:hemerythrin family protein [Deltaproteobacteria bacterium]
MTLVWSGDYSVKVGVFDGHHKKFFDIMNTLYDAMSARHGGTAVAKTINSLIEYTKYHFGEEERLMSKYNFEGAAQHKAEHQTFIKKVAELKEKLDKGDTVIAIEAMRLLKDWFSKHILDTDKKYSLFFNEKGVV